MTPAKGSHLYNSHIFSGRGICEVPVHHEINQLDFGFSLTQ